MEFFSIINWQMLSSALNSLLLLCLLIYSFVLLIDKRKKEKMYNLHKKKNSAQKLGERFEIIRVFYTEIEDVLKKKEKEHYADFIFYGFIMIAILTSLGMLVAGQYVLAFVYPILFFVLVRKIFQTAKKDPIIELEEELPTMIDNMIRVFSKYRDIKTIIYETSLSTKGPLKIELEELSRKMNSRNPVSVLEEFSEKHNSVWMNSFAFTLLGYLQDSPKEETIKNLRHLRKLLEQENTSKKKAISERKPSLMINYALAVLGVVGGFANILLNRSATSFFFHSYLGLFCFTAGFGFILATIFMNIKMMKIEK